MATPQVSAIIIVLNGEAFIEEAIASVVAQNFADWELIVVDDGSTDGTVALVQEICRHDPARMRLAFHPDRSNHGMSASRNLGIAAAQGRYVAFLDADDMWLPGKLEAQVAILEREPECAMVYGRTRIWRSWNPGSSQADFFYDLGVAPDATYLPPMLFAQLLRNTCQTPTTCNAMMRRDATLSVGAFDARFRDMYEDQLFFAKMLLRYPVHVSGACWANYRQHDDTTSARYSDAAMHYAARTRFLRALRAHVARSEPMLSSARLSVEREIALLHIRAAARRIRSSIR